jgi:hypothetical protein
MTSLPKVIEAKLQKMGETDVKGTTVGVDEKFLVEDVTAASNLAHLLSLLFSCSPSNQASVSLSGEDLILPQSDSSYLKDEHDNEEQMLDLTAAQRSQVANQRRPFLRDSTTTQAGGEMGNDFYDFEGLWCLQEGSSTLSSTLASELESYIKNEKVAGTLKKLTDHRQYERPKNSQAHGAVKVLEVNVTPPFVNGITMCAMRTCEDIQTARKGSIYQNAPVPSLFAEKTHYWASSRLCSVALAFSLFR